MSDTDDARKRAIENGSAVDLSVEVDATPEQIWEAIATGPGLACWFVPAEIEEREGGSIVTHHGPFGSSKGTITAYERPHRFAYEERDWDPEKPVPPWITEILVEARQGGVSVVRLVSGVFADGDWSDEIGGSGDGWALALGNLRIHFERFAGQACESLFALATVEGDEDDAWAALRVALPLGDVTEGDRVEAGDGAPALSGVVEAVRPHTVVLRSEEPAPGIVEVLAMTFGKTHLFVRGYLYGEDRARAVERAESEWGEWLRTRFPGAEVAVGAKKPA
jgi:uncharacterized protein YndB with AHSA1/START domain